MFLKQVIALFGRGGDGRGEGGEGWGCQASATVA